MPKAKERTSDFGARLAELRKAAGYTQVELAAALDASADELLGIKPLKKGKKLDTQLHRRLQRIEKLDPKAKRQITQLLDTFIEREELKQRVNAQAARAAGLLTLQALARLLNEAIKRRQAADALLSIAHRVAEAGIAPMSMDEINAEVKAARAERRARQAKDDDSSRS